MIEEKVLCKKCGKVFNEMQVYTSEFQLRYFADDTHRFNHVENINLCEDCTKEFLSYFKMEI